MAQGFYGTVRPATVQPQDVEAFYTYVPSRDFDPAGSQLFPLDASTILRPYTTTGLSGDEVLGGLYNLRLPRTNFDQVGVYTIYLRPKKIPVTIADCGSLTGTDDVRGIVIDTGGLQKRNSGDYDGYVVEYLDSQNRLQPNLFRIVSSSNRCELVSENLSNTSQKAFKYRFNEIGNLLFLTLLPSTPSDVKPGALPFLGLPGQRIYLYNTHFNPLTVEVELVRNNADTLAVYLAGNQVKDVREGVITYYDENNRIFDQKDVFEIQDEFQNPLYEVRRDRATITDQDFNDIIRGVEGD